MLDAEYTVSRPRRLRLRTWLLLFLLVLAAWSVASYWIEYRDQAARRARESMAPAVGAYCKIVFDSAAVGIERSGTRATEIAGAPNYLAGQFVKMNAEWVVIKIGGKDEWIARDKVLFMEVGEP